MTTTPKSLHEEHQGLLQYARLLAREGGEPALRLLRLLETHLLKEENFAAPPLGLLPRLARGEIAPGMADVLTHSEWLRRNIAVMHGEHQMIGAALEDLLKAAGPAAPPEMISFAETLLNHARFEEEVLYPAAIVAGEYLKLRLGERAAITAA
jgi:iron-sulfur cluster repair protein YtfE (RIC family)